MHNMKRNIALATLLLLAAPVFADVGIIDMGCTNVVNSNIVVTVNLGNAVKLAKNDNVGLLVSFQGVQIGTDTIKYNFVRSADAITWETTPTFTIAFAANGTTNVVAYTNIPASMIGAAPYIKLNSITAAVNPHVTNHTVKIITKTLKPSP